MFIYQRMNAGSSTIHRQRHSVTVTDSQRNFFCPSQSLPIPIPIPNPPHRSRKQTVRILSAEVGEQLTVQVGRYTGMVCATTIHQSLNHTTTTHHHPHSPTPSAHNLPTTDRRLQAVQTSRLSQSLRPPSGTVAAQQAAQLSCTVEV